MNQGATAVRTRASRTARAAGWVTVGVVAASGVGVATAATTHDAGTSGTVQLASAPAPSASAAPKDGKHHRRGAFERLQGRVLHGQATVLGKDGKPVVVAEQRGTVDAVSPTSITLTSKDGFKQTYVVTAETRVRVDGKKSTIASVKTGDTAGVLAKVNGTTQTAWAVIERAPQAKPAA